jgi:hypothetical protein
MNNSDWNQRLRRAFRGSANPDQRHRRVRLPSDRLIRFGGDVDCADLFLTADALETNMQDDAAAFEGWAVVLMAWCGVQRVAIDWEEPTNTTDRHYQRFLYRLGKFEGLLGPEVVHVVSRERLTKCRVGNGAAATLNVAGSRDTTAIPSRPGSEAALEKRLTACDGAERARLCAKFDFVELDRQVPVGVFDGPPIKPDFGRSDKACGIGRSRWSGRCRTCGPGLSTRSTTRSTSSRTPAFAGAGSVPPQEAALPRPGQEHRAALCAVRPGQPGDRQENAARAGPCLMTPAVCRDPATAQENQPNPGNSTLEMSTGGAAAVKIMLRRSNHHIRRPCSVFP